MANLYRLGNTILTFAQREYLYAAIGRGYTRTQVRAGLRSVFGIGFSNATFTQARKAFTAGRLMAARANLSNEERKAPQAPPAPRFTEKDYRRYNIQGTVTLRNLEGDTRQFYINYYQSDNSLDAMNARVGEIIDAVNEQSGSDWTIDDIVYTLVRGVESTTVS